MKYGLVNISIANSKLGARIPSVNLPPVLSCNPNAPCAPECYACKARFLLPNVKNTLAENWALWNENPAAYEAGVQMAAEKAEFFRWHSAGDIPSPAYLQMMVRIAESTPRCTFLAFTKQYGIVNSYLTEHALPENLRIVFSAWDGWPLDNPNNLPVAYVRLKKGNVDAIPENAQKCPKYCGDCVHSGKSCWHLQKGEAVVFDEH
jgi:hypothetical protein